MTGIENFEFKATSERDAIRSHAMKILRYRALGAKLTYFRIWLIMVLVNLLFTTLPIMAILNGDFEPMFFVGIAFMYIYLDVFLTCVLVSIRMSLDPKFDWAEDYKDLIEEWRVLRKKERDEGLPRSKF